MNRRIGGVVCLLIMLAMSGCSVVPSTTRRSVATGLGAAAGGAAGYAIGGKSVGWGVAGAGMGAVATALAAGKDPHVAQENFEEGYVQGQADAIKRQYFLRQALEATPLPSEQEQGKAVHYVVPGPEVTADGRKLEPHTVTFTVTE
jgi:uncharacterized protein YceK